MYSPAGAITKEKFGTDTALYNKSFYNSRGQLAEIRVGAYNATEGSWWNRGAIINHYSNQCWGACNGSPMTDNNGNLKKQDVYIPLNDQISSYTMWTQQYDYDNLNRLQRVKELNSGSTTLWQQEYGYDRYGNRTIHQTNTWGAGINKKDFTVNTANNRLGMPGGQTGTMAYDAAGNLTTDTYSGAGVTRAYDAENRMTSETQASSYLAGVYTYNAGGQRVRRKVNDLETWQVYGFEGELLAEYPVNVSAASPQKEYGYRNGQLLITAEVPRGSSATNVALAANGAVASASSTYNDGTYQFPVAAAINGDRKGLNWGTSSGWADFNQNVFPDWLQIDFNGSKSLSEIDVFTEQDNRFSPAEPTEAMTFSLYGLTGFEVQYWNGSAWVTVPGGSVTGNNKVWKKITFSPITTSKIRVLTNASPDGWSRIWEVEAWGTAAGGGTSANINWLVADQLGTPRMIFDKTGALATTKRHDYLPFGEELFASQGVRSAGLGYTGDTVRQKFTTKERDNETGLDYFGARYYASMQGRFSTADPLLSSGEIEEPQSWNRYSYTLNNPLVYTDPLGLFVYDKSVSEDQRKKFEAALEQARQNLAKIAQEYGVDSTEYATASRALAVYGEKGVDNGVTIATKGLGNNGSTHTSGVAGMRTTDNPTGQSITVNFGSAAYDGGFQDLIGHEGSHAADGSDWVSSGFKENKRPNWYSSEVAAFTTQSLLIEAESPNRTGPPLLLPGAPGLRRRANPYVPEPIWLYRASWTEADKATLRRSNIDAYLARPQSRGGTYGLTPASKEKLWRKGAK